MKIKYVVYYDNTAKEFNETYECNEDDYPELYSSRGSNKLYIRNVGSVLETSAPIGIISYKIIKK